MDTIESLRQLIKDATDRQLLTTAAFLAEKLVILSSYEPVDVALLANVYIHLKQPKRAIHVLKNADERSDQSALCVYYLARCLNDTFQHDQCLQLLSGFETDDTESGLGLRAAAYVVQGKANEALDRRTAAAQSYIAALRTDPRCFEALSRLLDAHLISIHELQPIVRSLAIPSSAAWIKDVYHAALGLGGVESGDLNASQTDIAPVLSPLTESVSACAKATIALEHGLYKEAVSIAKTVLVRDPFNEHAIPVLIAALVELDSRSELFSFAHKLAAEAPNSAATWHAVGCYYLCLKKADQARRALARATVTDGTYSAAWIAFGHACALADESDQAVASYRTAARLFPGSAVPLLCVAAEYLTANNFALAEQHYRAALQLAPMDPHALHGLGVVAMRSQNEDRYESAAAYFERVLEIVNGYGPVTLLWEPTLFNLGHCYRKQRRYDDALEIYHRAQGLAPSKGSVCSAIGYTYHLMGNTPAAIDSYHKALALSPDDTFTSEMLSKALRDASDMGR